MLKLKVIFLLIILAGQVHAQSESTSFSKADIDDFWHDHAVSDEGTSIGVLIDSDSCNGQFVLSLEQKGNLYAFLQLADPKYKIEYVNYGKFGKENMLLSSACGLENSNSTAWNIFKLNKGLKRLLTDEEKKFDNKSKYKTIKCFESSSGISMDQPINKDIWIIVYTSSTYNMKEKIADYGRKAPYPYCDNFHKYDPSK